MSSFPNFSNIADYVVNEINRRKSDTKVISELNCWARVISGVDAGLVLVSNPNIPLFRAAGQNIDSLYGSSQTSGTIGKTWSGGAVNTGFDPQVGLPSPIISSFEVDEGSGTISRKATFTVTAYTRKQLEEVTKYFLEPGFTVFLEWGWNTKTGVAPLEDVTVNYVTKAASAKELNEARKKSEGHYECYLGFITGGDISFNDGKWNVSVKLSGFTELPSYLNASDNSTNNECGEKVKTEEFTAITNTPTLGKKRFKQAFNLLPTPRRTNLVKGLINDIDVTHPVNFVNFDEGLRKQLADNSTGLFTRALTGLFNFFGGNASTQKVDGVSVPNGADIIGSERFIRFGTLMKIINKNGTVAVKLGDNDIQMYIDTKNTPISAFDRIFSTDKSKLIIPNQKTPKFSIERAKAGDTTVTTEPPSNCSISSTDKNPGSKTKTIKFPYRKDIKNGEVDGIKLFYDGDVSYVKINKKGKDWGFLDDLYINFDFAISVLDTPKLSLRDALYELLNGMSSAVNGLWNFQIQESNKPDDKGLTYLRVVDMNFISDVPNTKKDNSESTLEFQLYGIKSVFIDSTFTVDLGGAMMNKIIGERLSATLNPSDQPTSGRLFSSATDQVLNSLKTECPPSGSGETEDPTATEKKDLERKNLEKFVERVGAYPLVTLVGTQGWFASKVKSVTDVKDIAKSVYLISFDDKNLFNEYKLIDTGQTAESENSTITENDVSTLLPITFSFTIHGISGIKKGDMFTVNGLPDRYGSEYGFFQVLSVKHIVSKMSWTTTIEGGFRTRRKKK
jgi:hypothetical protein